MAERSKALDSHCIGPGFDTRSKWSTIKLSEVCKPGAKRLSFRRLVEWSGQGLQSTVNKDFHFTDIDGILSICKCSLEFSFHVTLNSLSILIQLKRMETHLFEIRTLEFDPNVDTGKC